MTVLARNRILWENKLTERLYKMILQVIPLNKICPMTEFSPSCLFLLFVKDLTATEQLCENPME